jgi:hypothetical protein
MLCKNSIDLQVKLVDFAANDAVGVAHWEATYQFSDTGKKVHNVVEAKFEFEDGKITKHQDDWDFCKWSNMALGSTGRLLGWTPIIKNVVKKKARKKLLKFMEELSSMDENDD